MSVNHFSTQPEIYIHWKYKKKNWSIPRGLTHTVSFEKCWSIPHELLTQGSESPVQPPPPLLSACLGHIRIGGGGSTSSLKMVPQVTPHLHHSPKPLFRKEEHKSTLNGRVRGCWQTLGLMISEASFMATRLQVRRSTNNNTAASRIINAGQTTLLQHSWGKIHFILTSNETNKSRRSTSPSPWKKWNPKSLPQI